MIIKVDRVPDPATARRLEAAGANVLGLDIHPRAGFVDDRTVAPQTAARIRDALTAAEVVGYVDPQQLDPPACARLASDYGLSRVAVFGPQGIPDIELRRALRHASLGIDYGGIDAAYDDDPSWILSRYLELEDANASFFQIELLAAHEDSWRFMRDEAPTQPSELHFTDLEALAAENPLLISVDFTPENVREVVETLPSFAGVALTLGALQEGRYDLHVAEEEHVERVLNALAARGTIRES